MALSPTTPFNDSKNSPEDFFIYFTRNFKLLDFQINHDGGTTVQVSSTTKVQKQTKGDRTNEVGDQGQINSNNNLPPCDYMERDVQSHYSIATSRNYFCTYINIIVTNKCLPF